MEADVSPLGLPTHDELPSRKRKVPAFGEDCDDEEPVQPKRNSTFGGLTDTDDHLVMTDEQWRRQKQMVQDLVAKSMGYNTYLPLDTDFMELTTGKGQTLYATFSDDDNDLDPMTTSLQRNRFRGNLLGVPFSEIKAQAEQEEHEEWLRKLSSRTDQILEPAGDGGTKLWVDKYAPKSFADLLSDERVNRNVLIWFKEWSGVVFGTPFTNPLPQVRYQDRFQQPQAPSEPKDRPDHICLLISGPPGIGKTTLAHIIAKQAGFDPVEFNASDDRTVSTFMPKVMDVVSTESRFGSNKPKALIIDEIDGVSGGEGKGAIDALAKLLDERKLKRPIICICNDVWAPQLRPLRDRCQQFRLDPPALTTLVSRLEFITRREGVIVDSQLLQVVCEMTNRDIRSCLNTLQFLSRKASTITPELFANSAFGSKDMSANIFDVWKSIFAKEEERSSVLEGLLESAARFRQLRTLASNESSGTTSSLSLTKPKKKTKVCEVDRIHALVKSANVDRVLDGIFENFPMVKYHDPFMRYTVAMTEWYQVYDEWQTQINAKQLFTLHGFIPYVAAAAHTLCSTTTMHQAIFPRQAGLMRATRTVNQSTVQQFITGILPPFRPYFDESRVVVDLSSFIVRILAPNLRPVNPSLLTPAEKTRLASLVSIHIAYGLGYVESAAPQLDYPEDEEKLALWRRRVDSMRGFQSSTQALIMPHYDLTTHTFGLTPPIHRLVHFSLPKETLNKGAASPSSSSSTDLDNASDSIRQMVSMAIHTEKLNRLDLKNGAVTEASLRVSSAPPVVVPAKEPEPVEIIHTDFFGRRIEPKPKLNASKTDTAKAVSAANGEKKIVLFYKYHEGKTDAVRRKVTMKDLL